MYPYVICVAVMFTYMYLTIVTAYSAYYVTCVVTAGEQ